MPGGVRKRIELIHVGEEWPLSTGPVTFTQEHLQSAVDASLDPAVRPAVIKLGHKSPYNTELTANGGEPAFGKVVNLSLSADGMTLYGDHVDMPLWLDDNMPTMYPRRSIEGRFEYPTPRGKVYPFVLRADALLGTVYPAISTLADIESLATAESVDDITFVDADELVVAASLADDDGGVVAKGPDMPTKPKKSQNIEASVSADDIRREYYDSLDQEDYYARWIRATFVDPPELIVSDDRTVPYLLKVPYTTNANDDSVTFGEAVKVKEVFQEVTEDVAASAADGSGATWYSTPEKSRPAKDVNRSNDSIHASEEQPVNPEHLEALGLEEGATDEQIAEAIAGLKTAPVTTDSNIEPEGDEDDDTPPATPPGSPPVTVPQQKADEAVTPETVMVDAAAWNESQAELGRLREMRLAAEARENDEFIAAALKDGRIAPAVKGQWRKALDSVNASEVRATIESFPKGTINVTEQGHSGHGEDVEASETAEYPAEWGSLLSVRKANA
jgi:hypothetical protein